MAIACISDTHFGGKAFSKTVFERMIQYFENVFFPYVLKNNIKHVIHLGDLVHNRNIMDEWILSQMKSRFFQFFDDNDIQLYCLVGNHDSYYKNTIEHNFQRTNLKEFKNTIIIDTIEILRIENYAIGFVPWLCQLSDLEYLPDPSMIDLLIGHFEMSDVLMQGKTYSNKGIDPNIFSKYKLVLSGHFHATSQKNNIRYIGTQYQLDWRDYGNEKGFWLLKDNLSLKYMKNSISPNFLKLYYSEQKGEVQFKLGGFTEKNLSSLTFEQACEYAKKHFIKFIVKQYQNQDLLAKFFETLSKDAFHKVEIINEATILEDFDFEKFEEELKDDTNMLDLMQSYVMNTSFTEDIDLKILADEMKFLYESAFNQLSTLE